MTDLIWGAALALIAVILGAFAAHALKKKFNPEQQLSFETGVRYQMYHALVLLIVGFAQSHQSLEPGAYTYLFILGTLLFSGSIYGLCLSTVFGKKWRFLGPVTPIGGSLLVAAWVALLWAVIQ